MTHKTVRLFVLAALLLATLGCGLGGVASRQEEPTATAVRVEATSAAAGPAVTVVETVEVEKEVVVVEERVIVAPAPEEPPGAMFFEGYGVNPFIDTEDDHLSTFALDVDTGSYTVARGYVQDGFLPPEEAVRVEEFVNYFDQGYKLPREGDAFAIYVDGAPFPFSETERYEMMRVGIQGYAVPPEERKDVSLTFVIDVSGSMGQENRLELVKRSLELLVEQLRPSDSVGIVVYGSEARVVLEPTSGEDMATILEAIYRLQPEGSTNAEGGLRLGYERANQAFKPGAINRVILCSDGVANVGQTGPEEILEVIGGYASEGITLTSVGFGMGNYNDVLMEQLADKGDGFYAYVDTLAEAERLFVHGLTGTLQTIAMDAKVQVDFDPDVVTRYRLVGFENRAIADEQFRDDRVDAGEIGAGHSVTALYEIKLHPEAEGRIATVHLRWRDPETSEVMELSQGFYTEDLVERLTDADPHFQCAVVVAEYAEVLRGSHWAEASTLAGVLEEAERVAELVPEDADMAEFVELVRQAARIGGRE
ncbi:MAG TPA: von Willebrand factor type A domain-containing protein [Anaerolineae bacterium]|nr:von Willebrand factor type A domain-containing protein [Anaerolineae bacterium]